MQCPQCQAENPPQAKFCMECAAPFVLKCNACGAELPAKAKFCFECAHPVEQPAPVALAPPAPASYTPQYLAERIISSRGALEGERKQVTVLFADLKGSMELLADRDPEAARAILDPVLERMMEAVHRYEGTVNQVLGDGIMALFGAPLAHEDHAVRACYAALRMQEAVKQYAVEIRPTVGLPIQTRVGLNSGEVVVRSIGSDLRMDYTAVGQTTHLAARMEQVAPPGAVLLAPDTLRLVEGYVQVKGLGPTAVKGLPEPVEVYELLGAGAARSRLQAAAGRGFTTFVGRDTELETLRQTLDRAGSGHGQVVALVGEPGVGKSRLVWEFTHSHRAQGWLVLAGGSVSYGKATSYLPVIDLLRRYCGIEARDDARRMREKVAGKVLMLDEALRPTLPPLLALLDVPVDDPAWQALDPPQRRSRTLEALKRLFLRESQEQPLLLVCEDLHWIDAETQAALDRLVESLAGARLLLLVNYRPEYEHAWHRKTYYRELRLDPLPPASADALLRALLGDAPGLAALKRVLIERTEGNPFFLEESVHDLVEIGVLVGERGTYRQAQPLEGTQVPATVQALLAARIDRLAPEDKRLLQAAAVIGKDVPSLLLQAIAELPEEALRESLARLQTAEFLYETSLFPELEYTFKHALTHEVAYQSLLGERRRALHARIVDAIEALYPGQQAEQLDRLAYHAARGEAWEKAVVYLRQAGERDANRSALHESIAYFEQALAAVEHLPESRATLEHAIGIRLHLGPAQMAIKGSQHPATVQTYQEAHELAEQTGETALRFPALWGLWHTVNASGEFRRARELTEQLLALARDEADASLLLEAHHSSWFTRLLLGELDAALAHTEAGIALYDPVQHHRHALLYGGHDPGACALGTAARIEWLRGYPERALLRAREAVNLAQQLAHPYSLAFVLGNTSPVYFWRGDREPLQQVVNMLQPLAAEQGFPFYVARAATLASWLVVEQGRSEEGLAQIRQSLATGDTASPLEDSYVPLLAEAARRAGHPDEGLVAVTAALARSGAEGFYTAELRRVQGELQLAQGAAEEDAERCFQQALALAVQQSAKSLELRATMSLARLWQQQSKREQARQALAGVYAWFSEGFDTRDLREARALLEELSS
jgi:class 3 adenylate cyclase/tetratricopeptide (TPR) repeat protein